MLVQTVVVRDLAAVVVADHAQAAVVAAMDEKGEIGLALKAVVEAEEIDLVVHRVAQAAAVTCAATSARIVRVVMVLHKNVVQSVRHSTNF